MQSIENIFYTFINIVIIGCDSCDKKYFDKSRSYRFWRQSNPKHGTFLAKHKYYKSRDNVAVIYKNRKFN